MIERERDLPWFVVIDSWSSILQFHSSVIPPFWELNASSKFWIFCLNVREKRMSSSTIKTNNSNVFLTISKFSVQKRNVHNLQTLYLNWMNETSEPTVWFHSQIKVINNTIVMDHVLNHNKTYCLFSSRIV